MTTTRRALATTLALGLVLFAPQAHADTGDDFTGWPYNVPGQRCIEFDGTILDEGAWRLVWPTEFIEPQGFMIPAEATGTMLLGTPYPCAPREAPDTAHADSAGLVLPATGSTPWVLLTAALVLLVGLAVLTLGRHRRE